MSSDTPSRELEKYRSLILATLDYEIMKLEQAASGEHLRSMLSHFDKLKEATLVAFEKRQINKLTQWFRDITEGHLETRNFAFTRYLKEVTGYDIDIFANYFARIDTMLARGRISSDNQFYDASMLVDHLSQSDPVDTRLIERLNSLISDYEQRCSRRKR